MNTSALNKKFISKFRNFYKSKVNPTIILALIIPITFSCKDELLKIDEYESQVVVDGWIEKGKTPAVILTQSMSYFDDLDRGDFRDLIITYAKVTISDGDIEEVLTLKNNPLFFPPYVYEGTIIRGEVGKTYYLTVEYNNNILTATTSIPEPVLLDSIWFKDAEGKPNKGLIWIKFTDDVNSKNYYKTVTRGFSANSPIISNYFSLFDDVYFSGKSIEAPLYNTNTNIISASDHIYFTKGDSVYLNFSTINRESFLFWSSFTKEMLNGQNPFAATNSKIESNINNGLGIWCGYGSTKYVVNTK